MPIVNVQTPDGNTLKINAPEGASQNQILGFAKQQFEQHQALPDVTEQAARDDFVAPPIERPEANLIPDLLTFDSEKDKKLRQRLLDKDPDKFMDIMQKSSVKGFNQGVFDIGDGLKQLTIEAGEFVGLADKGAADDFTKQVANERKSFEETYGLFPGAKVTRFVGANAPLAMIPVKMPAGLLARVGASSAFGAGLGGTHFVEEGGSRTTNTAIGATAGAALPLAIKGLSLTYSWAKNIAIDPFSQKGMYRDVAKFLRKAIPENREKIITAMEESIARGEKKTVAQIIAEVTHGTEDDFGGLLVRLERDLSRSSDVIKSTYASQSASRRAVIDAITGAEDDLAKAIAARAGNAKSNYATAFKEPVTANAELKAISENDFFKQAWNDANKIAQVEKIDPKNNLTEFLHYVKEGLDKQLNATDLAGKTALGRAELKSVGKVKDKLVKWLSKKNPAYEHARAVYEADSIPVNRMELGNELKKSLIDALGKDRPSVFANAVQEAKRTIKRAGGMSTKKGFSGILDESEVKALDTIKKELSIESQKAKMATASDPILKDLTGEVSISLPHILSRPIVVANHALKALGRDNTPLYRKILKDLVHNPNEFLRAYRMPSSDPKAKAAIDIVNRLNIMAATKSGINESTLQEEEQ